MTEGMTEGMMGHTLPSRLPMLGRSIITAFLYTTCAFVIGTIVGCTEVTPVRNDVGRFPEEWATATVDPRTGGRTLKDRQAKLSRFQDSVLAAHNAIPYPHYANPSTVLMAVKTAFIESSIRQRLRILLENEASSDLEFIIITDAPVKHVESMLGLAHLPAWERVSLIQVAHPGSTPVTFPFVRDYAPIVRVRASATGFEVAGLVLFGGSNLNKVLDRELDVNLYRNLDRVRERKKLTSRLIEIYKERLRAASPDSPEVLTHSLQTLFDGSNLITDGRGTCFLTRVVVDKNSRDAESVRVNLKDRAGCVHTVFLEAPQRLDANQHVDTLLYFSDPQNAVLSMPTMYATDRKRELRNIRTLLGLGYTVHLVPRKTASLSYANILTTRENVYVPQYTSYIVESEEERRRLGKIRSLDRKKDREEIIHLLRQRPVTEMKDADARVKADNLRALEVARALFPEKKVVGVNSDETLGSMGSWHCLAHELP